MVLKLQTVSSEDAEVVMLDYVYEGLETDYLNFMWVRFLHEHPIIPPNHPMPDGYEEDDIISVQWLKWLRPKLERLHKYLGEVFQSWTALPIDT